MNEEHGGGGHEHDEPHDDLDGIPRISDIKPHSKQFLWTILIGTPLVLAGLAAVQLLAPEIGRLWSWYIGLALVMVPAGLIMVRAVWHSTKAHEETH